MSVLLLSADGDSMTSPASVNSVTSSASVSACVTAVTSSTPTHTRLGKFCD